MTVTTDGSGLATFSLSGLTTAGDEVVTATATNDVTGDTSEFSPGPPVSIQEIGGDNQNPTVGTAFTAPLQVTVEDAYGNLTPGISVSFAAPTVGATAALDNSSFVTDNNGVVSVTATAGTVSGSYNVTATVSGLGNPAAFSVTNDPAAPVRFTVTGYPLLSAAAQPNNFTVTAFDEFNNVATAYDGLVVLSSNDALTILPGASSLTDGVGTFSAVFRSSGTKTITAADSIDPSITGSESGIQISPLVHVTGTVFTALVDQSFTATVATFTAAFPAAANDFTATIDWDDDDTTTSGTIVANGNGGFNVVGTHSFHDVTTFLVQVTVTDRIKNTVEQSAPTAAIVLDVDEDVQLQTFAFTDCDESPNGVLAAGSGGASAELIQTMVAGCDETLFVASYGNNPTATATDGQTFDDVRVTGADAQGRLVVNFNYGTLDPDKVILKVFDPTLSEFVPVVGSQFDANTLVNDTAGHVITVIFDSTSFPELTALTGTVFTIAVQGAPVEVQANVAPSQALALTSTPPLQQPAPLTDVPEAAAEPLTFQASGELSFGVQSVQDTARATSGGAIGEDSTTTGAAFLTRLVKQGGEMANDFARLLGLSDPLDLLRPISTPTTTTPGATTPGTGDTNGPEPVPEEPEAGTTNDRVFLTTDFLLSPDTSGGESPQRITERGAEVADRAAGDNPFSARAIPIEPRRVLDVLWVPGALWLSAAVAQPPTPVERPRLRLGDSRQGDRVPPERDA